MDSDLYDEFSYCIEPELDSDENKDEDKTEEAREHSEEVATSPCNNLHVTLYRIMNKMTEKVMKL